MRINLQDTTFLILIRLDSIQRLENICMVTNYICRHFDTNFIVLEADRYNNGFLKKLLNKNVLYRFVEDKDPILYKTKYYNLIIENIETPFLAIWDADVIILKEFIFEVVVTLRTSHTDVIYPYNGTSLEVSDIIRERYLRTKNINILIRNEEKMNPLYHQPMYGGAVFFKKEAFKQIGMDNEAYYGWGDEDFDRSIRSKTHGLNMYRTANILYHLSHPRGVNSRYRSLLQGRFSSGELDRIKNSSIEELTKDKKVENQ